MASRIFICHAAADSTHLERLESHLASLRREHLVELWHQRMIRPGEDANAAIHRRLDAAEIILLLVTPDFLASDECSEQVTHALARHRSGGASVVPILVRPVDWAGAPFAGLSHLPLGRQPVTRQPDPDEAWEGVAREVRAMVTASARRAPMPRGPAVRPPSAKRTGRSLLGAAALATAVVAGGATVLWIRPASQRPRALETSHLLWAPADCGRTEPMIGYDSCNDLRGLAWLQSQMNLLRTAGVHGFDDLPVDPALEPMSSQGKDNWLLYVTAASQRLLVGVGYQAETRSKDGCLRLYDAHTLEKRSATACLDKGGRWWIRDDSGSYRPLDP